MASSGNEMRAISNLEIDDSGQITLVVARE